MAMGRLQEEVKSNMGKLQEAADGAKREIDDGYIKLAQAKEEHKVSQMSKRSSTPCFCS